MTEQTNEPTVEKFGNQDAKPEQPKPITIPSGMIVMFRAQVGFKVGKSVGMDGTSVQVMCEDAIYTVEPKGIVKLFKDEAIDLNRLTRDEIDRKIKDADDAVTALLRLASSDKDTKKHGVFTAEYQTVETMIFKEEVLRNFLDIINAL